MVLNEKRFYKIIMKNIAGKFCDDIFVKWYFKIYDNNIHY